MKKCNRSYFAMYGNGLIHEEAYMEKIREMESGKYGVEWKVLYEYIPNLIFDPDRTIYMCGYCELWENDVDVSLYEPINPVETQRCIDDAIKKYGEDGKTIYEAWLSKEERDRRYFPFREYRRICQGGGNVMKKIPYEELKWLPCPDCGELNSHWLYAMGD